MENQTPNKTLRNAEQCKDIFIWKQASSHVKTIKRLDFFLSVKVGNKKASEEKSVRWLVILSVWKQRDGVSPSILCLVTGISKSD